MFSNSPIENALILNKTTYWNYQNREETELTNSHILQSLYNLIMFNTHVVPLTTLHTILIKTWCKIPNDSIELPEKIMFWKCLTNLYNIGLGETLFVEDLRKHGYTYPLGETEYTKYFKTVCNEMVFAEKWSNNILMLYEPFVVRNKEKLQNYYLNGISQFFHYNKYRVNINIPEIHSIFKDFMKYCSNIPYAKSRDDKGIIIAKYVNKHILIDNEILQKNKNLLWNEIYEKRFSEISNEEYTSLRKDGVLEINFIKTSE